MHDRSADNADVTFIASAMVYFVFFGAVTVAVALAAHLH